MPKRCSVAGCKSNYDKAPEHTNTFGLPKEEPLRSQWLRHIPTNLTKLKDPRVCTKHFRDSDLIWVDTVIVNGEVKEFPRKLPKYKKDAVPAIFPNLPKYLSSPSTSTRRLVDVEQENFDVAIKQSLEEYKQHQVRNTISCLNDIICYFRNYNAKEGKAWVVLKKKSELALCYMLTDVDCPIVNGCITVAEDLQFTVYIDSIKIDRRNLPLKEQRATSVPILEALIQFIENKQQITSVNKLHTAIDLLKSLPNYDESETMQFLTEQLILISVSKNARRYTNQTMIFASCLFAHSKSAYYILFQCKILCLPHPKNLQKLIGRMSLDSTTFDNGISYLETRKKYLAQHEFLVTLHIDEIYIQPEFSFKGGCIYGQSATDPTKKAKTAQVFMISSLLSKYKDVVSIIPVHNLVSEQLKDMCQSIICAIEKLGFCVIAVISDNNCVNRKAFELFSPIRILETSVIHPFDPNRRLFFIFDTVHILKCIRNNWISKKDGNKTLIFSHFEKNESVTAYFKHLELLYEIEKNSLVKYGHQLSLKALYPSGIQKQNVNLALKIFSENNITALKHISKDHPNSFNNIEGTCLFLDIIIKFWKITNVKSVFEGCRFNDSFREPIRRNSTLQIKFLEKVSLWLKNWRRSVPISDGLSAQTFQAMIVTIDSFLSLTTYLFDNYKIDYILLSKFQNDNLEGRFGMYRQMSGSNYYISFVQLLENERKIRFRNNVLLSAKNSNIPLKTLLPLEEPYDDTVFLDKFTQILELDFCLDDVPQNALAINTYIAGYVARGVLLKKKCDICVKWLQLDKEVDVDSSFDFLNDINRGKLTLPSEYVVISVCIVWLVTTYIMKNFQADFFECGKQLSVLHKLSGLLLQKQDSFPFNDMCSCETTFLVKLKSVCLTACKIFISNCMKSLNDTVTSSASTSNKRKIQKLC